MARSRCSSAGDWAECGMSMIGWKKRYIDVNKAVQTSLISRTDRAASTYSNMTRPPPKVQGDDNVKRSISTTIVIRHHMTIPTPFQRSALKVWAM